MAEKLCTLRRQGGGGGTSNIIYDSVQLASSVGSTTTVDLGFRPYNFQGCCPDSGGSGITSSMAVVVNGEVKASMSGGTVFSLTNDGFQVRLDSWHTGRTFLYFAEPQS